MDPSTNSKPGAKAKPAGPHWIGMLISNILMTVAPPAPKWLCLLFVTLLGFGIAAAIVGRILNCTPPSKKLFATKATRDDVAELDALTLASMDPKYLEKSRAGD